ncbi:MAG: hypothetical protein DHS20C18_34300 [Saprospiraceae bacterium]|nr:MAG: hypothetical protein DHS20C18_34300 [Saprospiraceae bacterium]
MKDIIDLIARVSLAFLFLWEAYDSINFFQSTKALMTEYGITWKQDFLLVMTISMLILGGILLLIGYRSGFGALLLLFYWVPVTFIVHSFWNDAPEFRRVESIAFMKNFAITGGLLMVMANGSGKYSVKRLFATFRVRGANRKQ